ncbi:tetratricopeptide repeat protein [Aestuariibaculum sediminum]|uniref:Tetratricopeptide repeat protein n=1 Tax=Aestuariibaculum sediminum TaxID=2770637 RepID=A0A8J6UEG4_9FLAO|nr:hypothetical protein [Aestuariibaculum sediminum]MBD0830716.1 hypothetical protein [Aestuariibaculum sediminum]
MKQFLFLFFIPIFSIGQVNSVAIQRLFAEEKFVDAENVLLSYLKKQPQDIEAIELLGDTYGHLKNWDKAIESYQALIDYNANNANYQYKYGGVLGMKALSVNKIKALRLLDDIEAAFLKASKLDSKHIDARWALVEYYMKLPSFMGGGAGRALQIANELEAISKVDGYLAKGSIYEAEEDIELAEKYYKMAINVGGSLLCYDKLTQFYLAQDEPEKAILNLKEAYKRHQNEALLLQIKSIEKDNF